MPRARSLKPALLATRYVLYEDGTFAFQFSSPTNPSKEMAGRYKQTDGVVTFDFDPVSVATDDELAPAAPTSNLLDEIITLRKEPLDLRLTEA